MVRLVINCEVIVKQNRQFDNYIHFFMYNIIN